MDDMRMPAESAASTTLDAWHWLPETRRMQNTNTLVTPRRTYKLSTEQERQLSLCHLGYHASVRAIDALSYAPGPIVCRVCLGGTIIHSSDKSVATERTVLWMADAANVLHEFGCRCAEAALWDTGVIAPAAWAAIRLKRAWVAGEIGDHELSRAWRAAMAAATSFAVTSFDAATAPASMAMWSAAWAVQPKPIWRTALNAARHARWNAHWDTSCTIHERQNAILELMLYTLEPRARSAANRQRQAPPNREP